MAPLGRGGGPSGAGAGARGRREYTLVISRSGLAVTRGGNPGGVLGALVVEEAPVSAGVGDVAAGGAGDGASRGAGDGVPSARRVGGT